MTSTKKLSRAGIAASLVALLSLCGISANASTSYTSYSTTTNRFGGYGYTAHQTKSGTYNPANLRTTTVGGNYVVSARTNSTTSTGDWTGHVVNDGTNHILNSKNKARSSERIQFKNRPQTRVQVQVSGTWRSN